MYSVCDMFKIGIGPSSSHTVGPMVAGGLFIQELEKRGLLDRTTRLRADIHGSLSLTGPGHHTDVAIIMGLAGGKPESVDIAAIPEFVGAVRRSGRLPLAGGRRDVDFPVGAGLVFHDEALPLHENGLVLHAFAGEEELLTRTYYSVGGGFVVEAEHFFDKAESAASLPYPFRNAADLLGHCAASGLTLPEIVLENELTWRSREQIETYFAALWRTMQECIARGVGTTGVLPGPLAVPRRAAVLNEVLSRPGTGDPMRAIDWINMVALAVSEENAAGGRVVTAPTNGACGIIPAVLAYHDRFVAALDGERLRRFFLTAGVIGTLYKMNASISGAEVGCQGEVGVACSMAAAGLAELMGAGPERVCIAAEIGMEHNLGLTCDPVAGQVQVPCIERNAMAAVKAVNAARMALQRDSTPCVPLDTVIEAMYETGRDMSVKYRETSCGGLAVKVGGGFARISPPCC